MLERWPGIAPVLLHSQVKNTAAFALTSVTNEYVSIVRRAAYQHEPPRMSIVDYFQLLASAHYTTVATFVPTDLDNSIRIKLWSLMTPDETLASSLWVLRSLAFDFRPVSARWLIAPNGYCLHGHHGEWFSLAVAAFAACRRHRLSYADELAEAIRVEMNRHVEIMQSIGESGDGLDCLRVATLVAHNLGDLDRVFDAWGLREEGPLGEIYRAGHEEKSPRLFWVKLAGELNQSLMAKENHRHFALRRPRCLRAFGDLLLPVGPFFDEWGGRVAKRLSVTDVGEVALALIDGWTRVGGFGYARALAGIEGSFPGGLSRLERELPARACRVLRAGELRARIAEDRYRFERRWAARGVELIRRGRMMVAPRTVARVVETVLPP